MTASTVPVPVPVPVPDPTDDGRHRLRDQPLERESMPYIIALPEHGLATAIYTWVDKDGVAGAMFAVCGPTVGDEPIMEKVDGIDVGTDDFDDWTVGPVHVAHALDLRTSRITGSGARIALDASFEGTHPAYAYSAHPEGCPPYAATDRIEQSGRVRGTLTLDGVDYTFDTTAARDHSWGTRDWAYPQHWKWVHAQAGETSLHFWQIQVAGGTELRGYVARDGELAEVTDVAVDFTVDDRFRQRTITAAVTDTAGRRLELRGEYFAYFELPPDPACILVEGGMACTVDGVPGTGWSEFMWPTEYRRYLAEQGAR